jgi:hypothetical protein
MYRSYQFIAKVKVTSTGKLLDSLPRNNVFDKLCSGEFKMAYCHDPTLNIRMFLMPPHRGI